jgi:sucrose-6-phosphate hydrolase SacC (GH32 family)
VERTDSKDTVFNQRVPQRLEAPLRLPGSVLNLNIVVDRSSIEVFADSGRVTMTNLIFPAEGAYGLQFYSVDEEGKLKVGDPPPASLWRLKSTF